MGLEYQQLSLFQDTHHGQELLEFQTEHQEKF